MEDTYGALTQARAMQQSFVTRVFGWMFGALAITAIAALLTVSWAPARELVFARPAVFFVLLGAELVLVIGLSAAIGRIDPTVATGLFILYSALNGVTLSAIFLVYTAGSLATTFFVAAGTFGIMFAYGLTTKRDLTGLGSLLVMMLLGLILASVVNLFVHSSGLYWLVTYAGVAIFVGLTAYDAQKIKAMSGAFAEGSAVQHKAAILGALALYLDFINLFLLLLRIFGRRR